MQLALICNGHISALSPIDPLPALPLKAGYTSIRCARLSVSHSNRGSDQSARNYQLRADDQRKEMNNSIAGNFDFFVLASLAGISTEPCLIS
jgi:hypothetical protein